MKDQQHSIDSLFGHELSSSHLRQLITFGKKIIDFKSKEDMKTDSDSATSEFSAAAAVADDDPPPLVSSRSPQLRERQTRAQHT